MGPEKSQPGRDQKTGRGCGNPAEDMAKQGRLRIAKAKHAKRQTAAPGQHKKPRNRGERPGRAAQFCAGADRDADDIRPRQELAQADDIEKFRVAEPAPLFNCDAPGPDDPAAKTENRYGQKCFGDGAERRMGGLLQRENGRHDLSVLVPVMQVGIMRMLVDETAMLVRMTVRFAVRIGRRMRVPMMHVMDMPVLVKEQFVHMLMLVLFGEMQIHARGHERGSRDQGPCDGLAEQRNRDRGTDKGSGREIRSGAGSTEVAQPQYEERQANAIPEETDDSRRGEGPHFGKLRTMGKAKGSIDDPSSNTLDHGDLHRIGGAEFSGQVVIDAPAYAGCNDQRTAPADSHRRTIRWPGQHECAASMAVAPANRRRSTFSRKRIQAIAMVARLSVLRSSEPAPPDADLSPAISSAGPRTPPKRTIKPSHGRSRRRSGASAALPESRAPRLMIPRPIRNRDRAGPQAAEGRLRITAALRPACLRRTEPPTRARAAA